MKLLEIFNTKPEVTWKTSGHQNVGTFCLDDVEYKVQIDEYEINDKTLVDFGFIADGTNKAVEGDKPAAKVVGAVLNSAVPKILSLKPDFILIAVDKNSGLVDSRKSIYDSLHKWLQRSIVHLYSTDWIENSKAYYKIFGNEKSTDEEIKLFIKQVKIK